MGLPNEVAPLIFGAKKYEISRSLRFNPADSAYLSRTFGTAQIRGKWTFSVWIKRSSLSATQTIFGSDLNNFIAFFSDNTLLMNLSGATILRTNAVYRDVGAWMHVVVSYDEANATATNRLKFYVNGTEPTYQTDTRSSITSNYSTFNTAIAHYIGTVNGNFGGYLTEINFVDGQALTPSSFGETDPVTGVWIPKRYTGTYGTNGFYLSFANNASTTTLGYDDGTGAAGSGAGSNDWTLNNFSVTAGDGNDSLVDTPTQYGSDTGLGGQVRGNYCTLNPLDISAGTLSDGNLKYVGANNGARCTIPCLSGSWYWECLLVGLGTSATTSYGIQKQSGSILTGTESYQYISNGNKFNGTTSSSYGATFNNGDVIGIAFDATNGTLTFYKNGVSQGVAFTGITGEYFPLIVHSNSANLSTSVVNFGQRPFSYTAPSGYKCLCSQNLPTPTILKGSQYMNIVTWTGTGATRSITGVGFQPDLVWSKSRSNAETHKLVDSTRGATKALSSETTGDEVTESGITSFNSDGFTIDGATDTGYNTNTYTYVGWNWKKGVTPGFDIVTYTGNGSARTISHSLGAVPHFMIVKARTTASTDQGWPVYHRNNTAAPETDYLLLNSSAATADLDTVWNDTAPTSSVFSVGTNALVNTNNDTYLAYLWTEIAGFSRFGSYTGNGSTDGPFVWCGFRPSYLLVKNSGAAAVNWRVFDGARSAQNVMTAVLAPDDTAAEISLSIDFLSNGFKLRTTTGSSLNASSNTYIFAAFAETPFKYSLAR